MRSGERDQAERGRLQHLVRVLPQDGDTACDLGVGEGDQERIGRAHPFHPGRRLGPGVGRRILDPDDVDEVEPGTAEGGSDGIVGRSRPRSGRGTVAHQTAEVGVDRAHGARTFAHRSRDTLHRSVPGCRPPRRPRMRRSRTEGAPRDRRTEIPSSDPDVTSRSVSTNPCSSRSTTPSQPRRTWCGSDEGEHALARDGASYTRRCVLDHDLVEPAALPMSSRTSVVGRTSMRGWAMIRSTR